MKKIIAIIAFVALAFNSQAQRFQSVTVPTVTAGSTSNSVGVVLDVPRQKEVSIQWNVESTTFGAGTNVLVGLSGSVDGSTFDTNRYSFYVTNKNILITNFNVGGLNYLRIDQIVATGVAATNTVRYSIKPNAP